MGIKSIFKWQIQNVCKMITKTHVYVKNNTGLCENRIFQQDCARKYGLYYSHFINCPGLLKRVFEEPDHSSSIK